MGTFVAIIAALFTVVGSVYARFWSLSGSPSDYYLTMVFYIVSSLLFPFALRFGTLSVLSTLSTGVTAVVAVLLGILIFREQVTPVHAVGIGLCVVSVVLLSWPVK